jgi:hypothetical protein
MRPRMERRRICKYTILPCSRSSTNNDSYRLFGRRVMPDRRCSGMNTLWRTILRTRSLTAIRLHRQPPSPSPIPLAAHHPPVSAGSRPYIHVLFKPDCAESWMTQLESQIPPGWLVAHGFGTMEHFDMKVGVASASTD